MNNLSMSLDEFSFLIHYFFDCTVGTGSNNMLHFHSLHRKNSIAFLYFGAFFDKNFRYCTRHGCNSFVGTCFIILRLLPLIWLELIAKRISIWIEQMDCVMVCKVLYFSYLPIDHNIQLILIYFFESELIFIFTNANSTWFPVLKLGW